MDPFSWRLHVFSINLLTPKCFVRGRCLRCVWNKTSVKRSTFYCKEILFPLSPYRKYYRRIIKLTMWKLLNCPPPPPPCTVTHACYQEVLRLALSENISWKAETLQKMEKLRAKSIYSQVAMERGEILCPEKSNHRCRKSVEKWLWWFVTVESATLQGWL